MSAERLAQAAQEAQQRIALAGTYKTAGLAALATSPPNLGLAADKLGAAIQCLVLADKNDDADALGTLVANQAPDLLAGVQDAHARAMTARAQELGYYEEGNGDEQRDLGGAAGAAAWEEHYLPALAHFLDAEGNDGPNVQRLYLRVKAQAPQPNSMFPIDAMFTARGAPLPQPPPDPPPDDPPPDA